MSDLTIAASENTFRQLFTIVRDNFSFARSDSANFGGFTASYAVAAHLEGGMVDLRDNNSVSISELDIKWDTLEAGIGFDIPEICIGGFCIIPNPFGGCLLRAPRLCIFSANPDIGITLPLSGITSEVSATARLLTKYRVDPARTPSMSDLEAEERDPAIPNKWQIFIDPITLDLDPLDLADTVGDLLENAVKAALNSLLGPLPGWAKDLILAILGPIIDLVRAILDLPDDIGEWLSNLLGVSLGLLNAIAQFIADYFANQYPLHEFEDPLPILSEQLISPPTGALTLIPVKIPVRDFAVKVNDVEMILSANVGA